MVPVRTQNRTLNDGTNLVVSRPSTTTEYSLQYYERTTTGRLILYAVRTTVYHVCYHICCARYISNSAATYGFDESRIKNQALNSSASSPVRAQPNAQYLLIVVMLSCTACLRLWRLWDCESKDSIVISCTCMSYCSNICCLVQYAYFIELLFEYIATVQSNSSSTAPTTQTHVVF